MLFKKTKKLPIYEGDERVTYENVGNYVSFTDGKYKFTPPSWIEKLVIVEANIAKVTEEGSFAAATTEVLDHLEDIGANGLWLTPIFDNNGNANVVSHYGNRGPHTFGDDCFKATDHEERKAELRSFIKRAHEKGIYVFIDVVTYGALATSPMYQAYINGTQFEGTEGYCTRMALDADNQVIGYEFVSLGKMTDFIKKGMEPNEAYEKSKGTYGRFADAVKYIDPRKE